jgi:nucleotide-binding universal stress UspA family protein
MGFTYVAFEGYEVIAQAGDETIDPKRNLPKAMIYSVFIVTLTYVAVAFASLVAVKAGTPGVSGAPWEWIGSFKEKGFGEAVSRLMPYGNFFLTLAVIFASISALNATIYSATRASYALGRDRMLPRFFAAISRKQKTPWVALAFTGLLVIGVAVVLPTMDVASSASIMFLFLFFLVNLSVIKIRLNMGDELSYGFIMPFFPWLPIIAILCQAVLAVWLIHMSLIAWIVAPVWILTGAGIYWLYSRTHALPSADEIRVLEEERAVETGQYKIMMAVANMNNALKMIRPTYIISEAKKASVNLIHMVPVPDQVPLTDAEDFMMEGREGILETMMYFVMNHPITTTIRYCRNIARGILSAVKEKKIDLLVLGWHGLPRGGAFILGSTVDLLLERSPSSVVVMKGIENQKFKKILVPWGGGPHRFFALEVARMIADRDESEICVLGVRSAKSGRNGNENNLFKDLPPSKGRTIETKTVIADEPARAILTESASHDLVILGSTRDPLIYQATKDSISHKVARDCPKPLMIVKSSGKWRAWVKRWI